MHAFFSSFLGFSGPLAVRLSGRAALFRSMAGILRWAVGLAVVATSAAVGADTYTVRREFTSFVARIDGRDFNLETMLYRPDDAWRHPLVILSHGRNGPNPARDPNTVNYYTEIGQALAAEGYVVAYVVRRGYGNSDGPDTELQDTAILSGLEGAKDYQAAAAYWKTKSYVLPGKIVLMGQSQGGWVSLACTTVAMPDVLGVVNLSGGTNYRLMGSGSITPAVQDHWVAACGVMGGQALVPSLWIYAENDLSISGPTARRMFSAFTDAGGVATMLMLPAFGTNGHAIVGRPDLFIASINEFFAAIGFDDKLDSAPVIGPMTCGESLSLGGTALLTATVTGFPTPLLQWRKDGVALSNTSRITDVTRSVLRISNLEQADSGAYTLVATNALGTAVSFPITVAPSGTVPAISTQPQSQTVVDGAGASFTVAATGNPAPSFQWQRLPSGSSTWANLAEGGSYGGVATATLTVRAATTAMSGDQFRCTCANSGGAVTSSAATLTVNAPPVPPPPPPSGGGGAIPLGFVALLALLLVLGRLRRPDLS